MTNVGVVQRGANDTRVVVVTQNARHVLGQPAKPRIVGVTRAQKGDPGKAADWRIHEGYLQWCVAGSDNWQNLISVADITGPAGDLSDAPADAHTYARKDRVWYDVSTAIAAAEEAYGWGDHAQAGYLRAHQSLTAYATQTWVKNYVPGDGTVSGMRAALNVPSNNDDRLADAREWTAGTVSQAEAEAGAATVRRAWTAQRVGQAVAAHAALTAIRRTAASTSPGTPYTYTLADFGRCDIARAARTIPAATAVPFPEGAVLQIYNDSAASIPVNVTGNAIRISGDGSTLSSVSIPAYTMAMFEWYGAVGVWIAAGVEA